MFNSIFVCGDSFPYGQELDEAVRERINFPSLIAQHYDVPLFNLSMPGGSNDRILRVSFTFLPTLVNQKPLVIIPWTQPQRKEFWNVRTNKFEILHPPPGHADIFTRLYFEEHSSNDSDVLRTIIAKISLQNLIKQLGLCYLFIEMFDSLPKVPKEYAHLEKLLFPNNFLPGHLGEQYKGCPMAPRGHPLEEGHQKMADYLIKEINLRYVR